MKKPATERDFQMEESPSAQSPPAKRFRPDAPLADIPDSAISAFPIASPPQRPARLSFPETPPQGPGSSAAIRNLRERILPPPVSHPRDPPTSCVSLSPKSGRVPPQSPTAARARLLRSRSPYASRAENGAWSKPRIEGPAQLRRGGASPASEE